MHIRRRIISAIDVELGPKPDRRLDGDLDQVGWFLIDCPARHLGSAQATLKVAQYDLANTMSRVGIAQHDSRHQLGPAISAQPVGPQ
jgi:hypothetical protein